MPLLIDCYNVLHTTMPASLAGLDEAGLCQALARSPWAGRRIVVVCDGVVKPHSPAASPAAGVQLVYSGPSRSADDVIISLIARDTAPRRLSVVTNDREIQKAARRRRAKVLSCERFIGALAAAQGQRKVKPASAGKKDRYGGAPALSPGQVEQWMREFGIDAEAGGNNPDDEGWVRRIEKEFDL